MTAPVMEFSDSDSTDFQCSIIQRAIDTATQPIAFSEAIHGIASGRWAAQVKAVSSAYEAGAKAPSTPKQVAGKMETPEQARKRTIKEHTDKPKKELPGVLFSGTFSRRSADALLQHSGLICADLDDLKDRVGSVKEQVCADPHVLAAFVSPTGSGLKVVFRCDPARDHGESFYAIEHYMLDHFGLQIDQACKDVSRICFVSHDPEAFVAPDAEILPYPPKIEPEPTPYEQPRVAHVNGDLTPIDDFNARGAQEIPDILEAHGWTHTHGKYWCRPGKSGDTSASWQHFPNTFHVFSSAPETGFPPDQKGFDPFGVYCHLEHNGDSRSAVKALGARGYGSQVKRKQLPGERFLADVPAPEVPKPTPDALSARRVRHATKPPEPVTRLFLNGKPVCTPANLTTIISRAKTGKTTALGAAVAAILGAHYDRHNLDTFKFTAPHTTEAVVLIDTEQAPYDAWTCHQRTLQRAGDATDPEWLHHYALVGFGAKQLRDSLTDIIAKAKAAHGGIFTVILDGVADFVTSVNDEAETNEFVAWLQALAVQHNTPIICVIHSNEGVKNGDDGRGHLGKQLTRKAESNLLLKKDGEITTITSDKQRKAPITEDDGVSFKWSDEHQRHVSCKAPSTAKAKIPKASHDFETFQSIFPRSADKALTRQALMRYATDIANVKESDFVEILHDAVGCGKLVRIPRNGGFHYHLNVPPSVQD